jgi:hypothetical protein
MISLRSRTLLKNCEKGLTWFRDAGFPREAAPFDLARCHFYIAGLAIHFFRFSSGNGFMPRSTTFTVACAVLPRQCTNVSISVARGCQWILFAIFAKTFAITEGFLPPDRHLERFFELMNLEKGLVVAALAILAGGGLLLTAVRQWWLTGFGHLDYAYTMRFVVPRATLVALGFQTVFSSFFVSILGM